MATFRFCQRQLSHHIACSTCACPSFACIVSVSLCPLLSCYSTLFTPYAISEHDFLPVPLPAVIFSRHDTPHKLCLHLFFSNEVAKSLRGSSSQSVCDIDIFMIMKEYVRSALFSTVVQGNVTNALRKEIRRLAHNKYI